MIDAAVPLAAIALVGSILALVVTPLFKLLKDNTAATNALVKETEKGNQEAKERNGHLGEQNVQIARLITGQNNDIASIKNSNALIAKTLSKSALIAAQDRDILTSPSQVIEHQEVAEQIVKHVNHE